MPTARTLSRAFSTWALTAATAFAALIYIVVGLPLAPVTFLLGWVVPMFEIAIGALIFLIVLDLLIWGVLLLIEIPLRLARRRH